MGVPAANEDRKNGAGGEDQQAKEWRKSEPESAMFSRHLLRLCAPRLDISLSLTRHSNKPPAI
jgi:hypothetical protein